MMHDDLLRNAQRMALPALLAVVAAGVTAGCAPTDPALGPNGQVKSDAATTAPADTADDAKTTGDEAKADESPYASRVNPYEPERVDRLEGSLKDLHSIPVEPGP